MTAAMVEKPAEAKPKVVELKVYRLAPSRHKIADYERRTHVVTPEQGVPFEALLQPEYWSHIAAKMRPFDLVEARAEDGSWYANLLVRDAGSLHAVVSKLNKWDFDPIGEPPNTASGYAVEWKGPHAKFAVVRLSDGKKLAEGLATRLAGDEWLTNYRKSLGN